jgi:hypothetical protein
MLGTDRTPPEARQSSTIYFYFKRLEGVGFASASPTDDLNHRHHCGRDRDVRERQVLDMQHV